MKIMKRMSASLLVLAIVFLALFIRPAAAEEYIVVANEHASTVQFFDLKTGKSLGDIATLKRPHEMVIDRSHGLAYISIAYKDGAVYSYEKPGNEIQVIDLQRRAIADTIDITPHWAPHGLALDEKGGMLYASCESNGGELLAINLQTRKVEFAVPLGGVPHPHTLTVVPSLHKAYTDNKNLGYISVVNLATRQVTKIPSPTGTNGVIATRDGKYVFAGSQTDKTLLVIDPKTDKVINQVPLEQPPSTFGLSPDGRKLYMTFWNQVPGQMVWHDGFIQELDIATLAPGRRLNVGRFPLNMTIASDGKTAIVDTTADGAVVVVDLLKMQIIRIVKTDEWPHGIAVF